MAKPKQVQKVAREGHVFLVAPQDVTGCSAGGDEYAVGEDGIVEVRAEDAAQLIDHGFQPAEGESPGAAR